MTVRLMEYLKDKIKLIFKDCDAIFLLVIVSALFVRLYKLGQYNFWYDEAGEIIGGHGLTKLQPFYHIFDINYVAKCQDYLHLYSHGLVYYWQLLFGNAEVALRISSVSFAVLSIYFIYLIGKEIFDINVGRLAGFLAAISPLHIHYSQELRPYALVCLLTVMSAYSLLHILRNNQKRHWFIYCIASILSVYFLYTNLLVILSFSIFLFVSSSIGKNKNIYKPFVFWHGVMVISLIPIFLSIYPSFKYIFDYKIEPAFSEFPIWGGKSVGAEQFLYTLKNFSIGYNTDFYSFVGGFATFFYLIAFLFGIRKFLESLKGRFILFCLFLPFVIVVILSRFKACYVDRYFFPIFPFYLLGVSAGLMRFKIKAALVVIFIIVIFSLFGLKNYYSNYLPKDKNQCLGVGKKQDIRKAANFISRNYKKGDKIMHTCKNTVFPLKFYIRQVSNDVDLISEADKGTVIFFPWLSVGKELNIINYEYPYPVTFSAEEYIFADKELKKYRRLWVIFSDWNFSYLNDGLYHVVEETAKRFKKEEKSERFEGAIVYLFSNDN